MKIILILLVVALAGALFVYKFIYNKQHPDFEKLEADYTLNVTDFYQQFKNDPAAAGRQYNGKIISLLGRLSKVETTDSLVIAVFVLNQGDFGDEGIRCTMLKKYNFEAGRLQPDGEVMIKGYCSGFNETDVILEKCIIENQSTEQ